MSIFRSYYLAYSRCDLKEQEQVGQAMYHDADLMSVIEEGMEGKLCGKRPGCLLCSLEKVLVRLLSSGAKNTCQSTC